MTELSSGFVGPLIPFGTPSDGDSVTWDGGTAKWLPSTAIDFSVVGNWVDSIVGWGTAGWQYGDDSTNGWLTPVTSETGAGITAGFGVGGEKLAILGVTADSASVQIYTDNTDDWDMLRLVAGGSSVLRVKANSKIGFFGTSPIVKPTGVAVSTAGIHAALVSLGLIAA